MPPTLPALLALALAQAAAVPPNVQGEPAAEAPETDATARVPTRRYVIERIEVRGLSRTRPEAVRRHVLVERGRAARSGARAALAARAPAARLVLAGGDPRRARHRARQVVVVFDVVERNTLVVTDLVLGSTRPQPLYGGLGLSQQNFLGQGLGLSGAFVYGGSPEGRRNDPDRYAVRAGFFAPDLRSRACGWWPASSALFLRGEELSCADVKCADFARQLRGGAAHPLPAAGRRPGAGAAPRPLRAALRHLPGGAGARHPHRPGRGRGPVRRRRLVDPGRLTGTYEVDTRDDFFYPTEGFLALGQVGFASRLVGGDYEYSRYLLQAETAYSLLPPAAAVPGGAGGDPGRRARSSTGSTPPTSPTSRVGPALGRAMELNFSTDSRYDALLAMAGLEYGFPLWTRHDAPVPPRLPGAGGARRSGRRPASAAAAPTFSQGPALRRRGPPARHRHRHLQPLGRLRCWTTPCDLARAHAASPSRSGSRRLAGRAARAGGGRAGPRPARSPVRLTAVKGRAVASLRPVRRLRHRTGSRSSGNGLTNVVEIYTSVLPARRRSRRPPSTAGSSRSCSTSGRRPTRSRSRTRSTRRAGAWSSRASPPCARSSSDQRDVDLGPVAGAAGGLQRGGAGRGQPDLQGAAAADARVHRRRRPAAGPAAPAACSAPWRASCCASRTPAATCTLLRSTPVQPGARCCRDDRTAPRPPPRPPAGRPGCAARCASPASSSGSPPRWWWPPRCRWWRRCCWPTGWRPRTWPWGSTRGWCSGCRASRASSATCSRRASSSTPRRPASWPAASRCAAAARGLPCRRRHPAHPAAAPGHLGLGPDGAVLAERETAEAERGRVARGARPGWSCRTAGGSTASSPSRPSTSPIWPRPGTWPRRSRGWTRCGPRSAAPTSAPSARCWSAGRSPAAVLGIWLARRTTRRVSHLVGGGAAAGRPATSRCRSIPGRFADEVADLTRAFNQMVREVRESRDRIVYLEKISGWQEVARRLAHEIKNPLTPMKLAFQQLEARWDQQGDDARPGLRQAAGRRRRDRARGDRHPAAAGGGVLRLRQAARRPARAGRPGGVRGGVRPPEPAADGRAPTSRWCGRPAPARWRSTAP